MNVALCTIFRDILVTVFLLHPAIVAQHAKPNDRLIRTVDAAVTSFLITEGIKSFVREERPNHRDSRSFPSEHTTLAFAMAGVQAHYDARNAPYWYAGAAAVGIWRMQSKEHFLQDVVGGGLIGFWTASEVVRRPRGLLVTALFGSSGVGVNFMARF